MRADANLPDLPRPWLHGALADLLFGCGLLFVAVAGLLTAFGEGVFRSIPPLVPELLIVLVSAPHYGATLVRVYDEASDRRTYFAYSVVATGALLALFGLALVHRLTASILVTLYLTWSGWHYTGQNYGIAALFLRRRGLAVDGWGRRLLHGSFVLSYLFAFFIAHAQLEAVADPRVEARFIPLAIPRAIEDALLPLLLAAYTVATVGFSIVYARRARRIVDLAPVWILAAVQALWWAIPYLSNYYGFAHGLVAVDWNLRGAFFPWVAGAHAAQYLWITSYYARQAGDSRGRGRYYLAILAAGSAAWALPALLFAPRPGELDWNFALLLAALVNLHHFVLDGAIWKLRQGRIARILIASSSAPTNAVSPAAMAPFPIDDAQANGRARRGLPVLRTAVWATAALGLGLIAQQLVEQYWIEPRAWRANDPAAVERSLARQSWLGRTNAYDHFRLGRLYEEHGDALAALRQFELSAAMEPRVESLKNAIAVAAREGETGPFVHACDRLFELDGIERPLPTIDLGLTNEREFRAFRDACVRVAQAARPTGVPRASATGGAGLDGRVERPEGER